MRLSPRLRVAFDGVMSRATHIREIMPRRQPRNTDHSASGTAGSESAADRAAASWDRFQLLANCLPQLVLYVDANELCRAHNNAVQDTLGVAASELTERSVRDILGEASYNCVKPYVARVLAGEQAKLRQVHRDRDGRLVSFDAWYVPHRGANDAVLGFCALLTPAPGADPTWPLSAIAGALVEGKLDDRDVDGAARGDAKDEDAAPDIGAARIYEHALSQFRAALQGDRFCLFQQPIVPIGAGAQTETAARAESYEVLLRLRTEEGRLIHPGAFLRHAEEIGFMRELDRWVVERVWRWFSDESRPPKPGMRLHLNLSTDSVRDESFPRFVRSIVGPDRARAVSLCFEIAEATLLEHRMATLSCAHALRMLGCRIALDRFKGASGSFSVMLDMPVDFVKIDSSLVTDLVADARCATKVKIIATLARSMGASSIAERVEDADTRDALARIGVDCVQGFGIAMPEALESL